MFTLHRECLHLFLQNSSSAWNHVSEAGSLLIGSFFCCWFCGFGECWTQCLVSLLQRDRNTNVAEVQGRTAKVPGRWRGDYDICDAAWPVWSLLTFLPRTPRRGIFRWNWTDLAAMLLQVCVRCFWPLWRSVFFSVFQLFFFPEFFFKHSYMFKQTVGSHSLSMLPKELGTC